MFCTRWRCLWEEVVGKALDNRIGCAMMAELLQTVNNPEITLYGVGSVEEEVGLRGAQTSAEHIKPDVVIVLDTAVAGDVPGIDNIKYPLKLGQGPGLMPFPVAAASEPGCRARWRCSSATYSRIRR